MRIGVTGHQDLGPATARSWVALQIEGFMSNFDRQTIAVSCLAVGADQLFAEIALKNGFSLMAILPFTDIRRTFDVVSLVEFERLLAAANCVETLASQDDDEQAYLVAGHRVVEICDVLVAVWNGLPAKGKGGTADIVQHARGVKEVFWINPVNQTTARI